MVVEDADVPWPSLDYRRRRFHLVVPRGLSGVERTDGIRAAIVHWYSQRAAQRLRTRVERWLPKFGLLDCPRVLIGNQRTRWGSCGVDGTIRLNWKLMMLRPSLIDYVVVHELAHLEVRGHSDEFWYAVARRLPEVYTLRRRLDQESWGLPL